MKYYSLIIVTMCIISVSVAQRNVQLEVYWWNHDTYENTIYHSCLSLSGNKMTYY